MTPVAVTLVAAPASEDGPPSGEIGDVAISASISRDVHGARGNAAPLPSSPESPPERSTQLTTSAAADLRTTDAEATPIEAATPEATPIEAAPIEAATTEAATTEAAYPGAATPEQVSTGTGVSPTSRRSARIWGGLIGATVLSAAILVIAISFSKGDAKGASRPASLEPAAASLVPRLAPPMPSASKHTLPEPAPLAAGVAAPPAAAPGPAKIATPAATQPAPSKLPTPQPTSIAPPRPESPPAQATRPVAPPRPAPAAPPRPTPAKRLTYDPNALFLTQP